jgi:hypothetical protein
MDEVRAFTLSYRATLLIRILPRIANDFLLSKVIATQLLTLTMFFKGRSKSVGVYSPKIMMLSPDKGDWNLLSI